MEFSQNFIFSKQILNIGARFVVLFGEFVEVLVGDCDLFANLLYVHQEGRILVLAAHFLESEGEL